MFTAAARMIGSAPRPRRARIPRILSLAGALACVLGLGGGSVGAAPAHAGQYHVYLCKTPAGHVVPLGLTRSWNVQYVMAEDDCPGNGGILGLGPLERSAGAYVRAAVTMPSGIKIAAADVTRRVTIEPGSDSNAVPEWVLYRDEAAYDDAHRLEACSPYGSCYSIDWPSGSTRAWSFPANDRASAIIWELRCGGNAIGKCGPSSGQRATASVNTLHLLLEESVVPDGTASGAATLTVPTHAGVESAQVSASDVGAGVYQVIARLDDTEVGRATVGGGCADRGNVASSDLDFEALQPCPGSANLTVPVDTRKVANGNRRLRLIVRDAADNQTLIYNAFITVANTAPTPTPAPGSPGGPNQAARPEGRIALDAQPKRALSARTVLKISGSVVTPAGQPVAGVVVAAEQRLRVIGAPWQPLVTATTDARGAFALALPAGASREVRLSYVHDAGTATAEATVRVRAALSITPRTQRVARFGRLRLSGRLEVVGLAKRGAYVDLQLRQRGAWRTIATRRTDQAGAWAWTYRLSSGQRATYQVRARLRPAADVASAPTTSRTVTVRVR